MSNGTRWTEDELIQFAMRRARVSKPAAAMSTPEFAEHNRSRFLDHKKPRKNPESELQQECVEWFRETYPQYACLLIASLNGAKLPGSPRKRAATITRLKAEGMVPGTADLFLAVPAHGSPGLWLEMKVPGNGQQESQKEFQAAVEAAGYPYAVPKSLDAFRAAINSYFKTGKPS